jgi:hypothetical protein
VGLLLIGIAVLKGLIYVVIIALSLPQQGLILIIVIIFVVPLLGIVACIPPPSSCPVIYRQIAQPTTKVDTPGI